MATDIACVWCGRPKAEHGEPGDSDYARDRVIENGRGFWDTARLCPTKGVTSQFYTTPDQLCGKTWKGSVSLPTCDCDGTADAETVMVDVEQSKRARAAAQIVLTTGSVTIAVCNLGPTELDRLAAFFTEAADMVRQCSE